MYIRFARGVWFSLTEQQTGQNDNNNNHCLNGSRDGSILKSEDSKISKCISFSTL